METGRRLASIVTLALVLGLTGVAGAATTLVDTEFDGSEPMTVTYAGYKDVGAGSDSDTYDGWVWQYTPNIPTWPSQEYRVGNGLELNSTHVVGTDVGNWLFGWGQQELRLTQSFASNPGDDVTVSFQWSGASNNSALDIDTGSGFTQVTTATGAPQTYAFAATGSSFDVRFASQRGADNLNRLLGAKVEIDTGGPPPPPSPTPLIEYLGGANNHRADGPYTVGNLIEVGSDDLLITHLGAQDDGPSGPDGNGFLAGGVDVGLWSADGSTLLASARVLSGDPLTGTYRYQELATPITLSANTQYLIGAAVGGGIEWFEDNQSTVIFQGSGVSLIENRFRSGGTLGAPTSNGGGTVGRWGPANALIAPPAAQGDIPEPATLAMLPLGAAGLGGYVRRRKK